MSIEDFSVALELGFEDFFGTTGKNFSSTVSQSVLVYGRRRYQRQA
jgi:hypothetical protein